jgi:hypothetical protein
MIEESKGTQAHQCCSSDFTGAIRSGQGSGDGPAFRGSGHSLSRGQDSVLCPSQGLWSACQETPGYANNISKNPQRVGGV